MHVLFLTLTGSKAMDSHTASNKLQTLANTHTEPPFQLPASLANIVTPLILKTWAAELANHRNPQLRDFIHNHRCITFQQKGVRQLFHYLDEFITLHVGPPNSEMCKQNLTTILDTCEALGVPMETDKTVGPSPQIVFLGRELDSGTFTIRLYQRTSWLH